MSTPEKNEGAKQKKKEASPKKIKVSPKLAIVQDVIHLMGEADISELSFEQAGVKIHLRRGPGMPFQTASAPVMMSSAPVAAAPAASSASAAPAVSAPAAPVGNTVTQNSPMVGTFYRSPSPDAKVFIEEGDKIEVGQVYCIIE